MINSVPGEEVSKILVSISCAGSRVVRASRKLTIEKDFDLQVRPRFAGSAEGFLG
jgi:hypothetical protein